MIYKRRHSARLKIMVLVAIILSICMP
jgi:hypothetical protein